MLQFLGVLKIIPNSSAFLKEEFIVKSSIYDQIHSSESHFVRKKHVLRLLFPCDCEAVNVICYINVF